jgi:hypothetical protein
VLCEVLETGLRNARPGVELGNQDNRGAKNMMRSIATVLSALALGACAHEGVLEPAAGAQRAPGQKTVAEMTAAGVTVAVTGDSWKGDPPGLGSLFTPVRVTIENHSGRPVRVSYRDFSLSGASGFHYPAIRPIRARGTLSARADTSTVSLPAYADVYPAVDDWPGPVVYAPYQDHGFDGRWPERLPTQDMLSEALPEGILQDGGKVAGFVYFRSVTGREPKVQFEMTLADASDGQTFASVAIPFQSVPL